MATQLIIRDNAPSPTNPQRLLLMRIVRVLVVLACGAGVLAGCGGSSTSTPTTTTSAGGGAPTDTLALDDVVDERGKAEVEIEVKDNTFGPKVVRVDPGTKVVWRNAGANSHNVISNEPGEFPRLPLDDTINMEPGTTVDNTFAVAGAYRYYCNLHGAPTTGQRGAIIVGDG
jgi:plastocyanin